MWGRFGILWFNFHLFMHSFYKGCFCFWIFIDNEMIMKTSFRRGCWEIASSRAAIGGFSTFSTKPFNEMNLTKYWTTGKVGYGHFTTRCVANSFTSIRLLDRIPGSFRRQCVSGTNHRPTGCHENWPYIRYTV